MNQNHLKVILALNNLTYPKFGNNGQNSYSLKVTKAFHHPMAHLHRLTTDGRVRSSVLALPHFLRYLNKSYSCKSQTFTKLIHIYLQFTSPTYSTFQTSEIKVVSSWVESLVTRAVLSTKSNWFTPTTHNITLKFSSFATPPIQTVNIIQK